MKAVLRWARKAVREYMHRFGRRSYSQEGEDLILDRFFEGRRSGFFVDVGAHHPFLFSNTYLFYARGWSGVNIDAMPGSMKRFHRYRSRDINIEVAIGWRETSATYYMFNEPALNTFDKSLLAERQVHPWRLIGERTLPVRRLGDVLAEAMKDRARHIDFMTIDVEGWDLDVLQSNDWTRFRPTMLLAEIRTGHDLYDGADPVSKFLYEQGYRFWGRTLNTTFMIDRSEQVIET